MTIHLSKKDRYKKSDSYSKKMTYTTSLFGASYKDYQNICKDKKLKEKHVIWYSNEDIQPKKRYRKRRK